MPYYSQRLGKNIASHVLNPEQAFELAANTATDLGDFLKIYRESKGKALEEVGNILSVNRERMRQSEAQIRHSDDFVNKILGDTNPYGFPVDESGKIRADVVEYIHKIHIPPRGTTGKKSQKEEAMISKAKADEGKWLGFGDVVREIRGIKQAFVPISKELNELEYDPRLQNWREYWNEALQALAEPIQPWQEGVLKIGGSEIRYKRGNDGEYRLHADGLAAVRAAIQQNLSLQ